MVEVVSHELLGMHAKAVVMLQLGMFHDAALLLHEVNSKYTDSLFAEHESRSHRLRTYRMTKRDLRHTIHVQPMPVNESFSVLAEKFSPHNSFVIYAKAFLFDLLDCPVETSNSYRPQLSAVLLYNLALSHHIIAISIQSSRHLHQSIAMYEQAIQILSHHERNAGVELNASTTLVLNALYNNIGHCWSHFAEHGVARHYHQVLESSLSSVTALKTITRRDDFELEYCIFNSSNLFFSPFNPIVCFAPAA